jgi:hypothetical protein
LLKPSAITVPSGAITDHVPSSRCLIFIIVRHQIAA